MDPVGYILGKMSADDVLKTKGYTDKELKKMTTKRKFEIAMSVCNYEKEIS